jgi:hypothetical protein
MPTKAQLSERLTDVLAAACPGLYAVGSWTDKQTWIFTPAAGATAPQIAAAANAIAAFDIGDAAQAVWQNLKDRATAAATIDALHAEAKALRAVASVLIDELNAVRQWLVAFKAATAASTNYATLKSGIGGLSNMPDRTLAQAKTAIQNAINAGTVD